jgi:hypothetical protein
MINLTPIHLLKRVSNRPLQHIETRIQKIENKLKLVSAINKTTFVVSAGAVGCVLT